MITFMWKTNKTTENDFFKVFFTKKLQKGWLENTLNDMFLQKIHFKIS